MVDSSRQEPGTTGYEAFLSADGSVCHLIERYADSSALMALLATFGTHFAERFMACVEIIDFTVYGEPNEHALAALAGFGASSLGTFGGFSR